MAIYMKQSVKLWVQKHTWVTWRLEYIIPHGFIVHSTDTQDKSNVRHTNILTFLTFIHSTHIQNPHNWCIQTSPTHQIGEPINKIIKTHNLQVVNDTYITESNDIRVSQTSSPQWHFFWWVDIGLYTTHPPFVSGQSKRWTSSWINVKSIGFVIISEPICTSCKGIKLKMEARS